MPGFHRGAVGFTLLELSIVLVIIGLLAGSVLVGRDLINSSGIKAEISQIQGLDTALQTFQDKYNCLPGDCDNIASVLPGAVNGNGNGDIEWVGDETGPDSEGMNVFPQLALAGLIEGTYSNVGSVNAFGVNFPHNKVGIGGVLPYSGYGLVLGAWDFTYADPCAWTSDGDCSTYDVFTPYQAYQIDKKIDDGMPNTGIVESFDYNEDGTPGSDHCLTNMAYDTTGNYDLIHHPNQAVCAMGISWDKAMPMGWW